MKKQPYRKNTVILNLREDLNIQHDINVEFWKDPSQQVVFDLLDIIGASYFSDDEKEYTREQIDQLNQMFYLKK